MSEPSTPEPSMSQPPLAGLPSTVPAWAHVSVGTDLEDVARFTDGAPGTGGADALFTDEERAHAAAGSGAASLTGSWCAKEAAVKALWPWIRLDPRRVHVSRTDDGRPVVAVTGNVDLLAGVQVQVSIAHTSSVASAVAVAWGPPPPVASAAADESTQGAAPR